ncbi:hypothetical protein I4F81_001646 [Pyropia yezoensis]|uniref:Uncharacterized protein n=1 Tax=Pyropia yezoensis TaxID=2788 RepID=A0ACC3BN65_PYRYE|nr:hypothetical protein I4F81_001646 [Neopyropia yezoensis]
MAVLVAAATSVHLWEAPGKKPLYTCVSPAVARALQAMPLLVGKLRGRDVAHIPVYSWSQIELQALCTGEQSGALLRADAASYGTVVAPSPVHGRGVFAARPLRVGQRILPFFGQLVHEDLEEAALSPLAQGPVQTYGGDLVPLHLRCSAWTWLSTSMEVRMHKRFWEGAVECSRLSWVPEIGTKVSVSRTRPSARSVWIVPASFCAAGSVNDPRPHRTANVKFEQVFDPVYSAAQLLAPGVVRMVVLRDILVGEELFVDYGAGVEGGGASGGVTQNAHPRCCCCSCGSAAADDGHADGAGEGGGTVIRGAAQRRGSERSSDGGCDGREVAGLGVRAPTLAAEATRTAR